MAEQFAQVQDALERALELGETGLQVAAWLDGALLLDQWAGVADTNTGAPVTGGTLFPVFSVTKGITAAAVHIQRERGLIDLDQRVAHYWPGFGANGKQDITVRHVLTHRSGVPQMPADVTPEKMCDWGWMIGEIETLSPMYPPGEASAYHALIWGWMLAEIVTRTDPARRRFGRFLDEEIFQPLGMTDIWLGLPEAELKRVAPLIQPGPLPFVELPSMPYGAYPGAHVHNLPFVQQACLPGAGIICNARSMAAFWGMIAAGGTLNGVRILQEETLRGALALRDFPWELDKLRGVVSWIGRGGFWVAGHAPAQTPVVGKGPNTLFSPGAGGSFGWADLDARLGVAVTHNHMAAGPAGMQGVADAVRAVAGAKLGRTLE